MTSLPEALRAWAEKLPHSMFGVREGEPVANNIALLDRFEILARLEAFARQWEAERPRRYSVEVAQLMAECDALKVELEQMRARFIIAEHHKTLSLMGKSSYQEVVEQDLRIKLAETELAKESGEAARAALRDNIVHLQRFGEGPAGATYRKPEKGFTYVRLDEVLDWLAASAPERTTCEWTFDQEDDDLGNFDTACGEKFTPLDCDADGIELWMKFCCHCGKPVAWAIRAAERTTS